MNPAASIDWRDTIDGLDWHALEALRRAAPLGNKNARDLETVFRASRFSCLACDGARLVAAGRALADGADRSYACDVAVAPSHQVRGPGKVVVSRRVAASRGHRKIILCSVPGKEGFCRKLTATAIFDDQAGAVARGHLDGV
jgi:hypothetical protein